MSRDFPYDPNEICDVCGRKGAFDFMGDYLCPICMIEEGNEEDEYLELEEELEDEDESEEEQIE